MGIEMNEEEIIQESIERMSKIKEMMGQPERFTEEEVRYVFENVNHEMRSRQISADKDRRMEKIAEEKKIGREFERKTNINKETKEESKVEKEEKSQKKKLEFKYKYTFSQKPGKATNKQLSFIQELRMQNEEKLLEIEVDVENVPKMSFDEANNEIRRLKKDLGWKQKEVKKE
jgi:hypothetical protein